MSLAQFLPGQLQEFFCPPYLLYGILLRQPRPGVIIANVPAVCAFDQIAMEFLRHSARFGKLLPKRCNDSRVFGE